MQQIDVAKIPFWVEGTLYRQGGLVSALDKYRAPWTFAKAKAQAGVPALV
jgi:hypothetical protein